MLGWIGLVLGACALTIVLAGNWYHVLPLVVAASLLSMGAFTADERPRLDETHALSIGLRATIQGTVSALVYASIGFVLLLEIDSFSWTEVAFYSASGIQVGLPFILPSIVEARARAHAPSVRRDGAAAIAVFITGMAAVVLGTFAFSYSLGVLHGGHTDALRHMSEVFVLVLSPRGLGRTVAAAFIFVPPTLTRLHEARPRWVLASALGAAVLSSLYECATPPDSDGVDMLEWRLAMAIALSLGPALADRLVRRIEPRSS
jgi:hypothetical protein